MKPQTSSNAAGIWLAISQLRLKLRQHVRVQSQHYRGERWYVLYNETSAQRLRVNAGTFSLIGRFDGKRSVATIVEFINSSSNDSISEAAVINIVTRLHHLDMLVGGPVKETASLLEHYRANQVANRWKAVLNPLMVRIPLFDPNAMLDSVLSRCERFLTPALFVIWALCIAVSITLAITNLELISGEIKNSAFKTSNLLFLWFLYPLLKLIHELAHAVAIKKWGGAVHEMGITLLVLTPVPYLDASEALSFSSKYKRMLVSLAGIFAELWVASLAFILWLLVEPGIVSDCAFNVFLLGSISTLLFNANPLLKFDGYYVLEDYIEIPNLATRSRLYIIYLFKYYVLRLEDLDSPVSASGEQRWFLAYGITSQIYRIVIAVMIVVFLSQKYLLAGVVLGVWAAVQQFVLPTLRFGKYIASSPEIELQRKKISLYTAMSVVGLLMIVLLLPLPSSTQAQGIVSVTDNAKVLASTSGFVQNIEVAPGSFVNPADVLFTIENTELQHDVAVLAAEERILNIKTAKYQASNSADYWQYMQDWKTSKRNFSTKQDQLSNQVITAGAKGLFSIADTYSLKGRYYAQGDLIGHIINAENLVVEVVVPESESGLILRGVISAEVRLAESLSNKMAAVVEHVIPASTQQLPSVALGQFGGGGIPLAASDTTSLTTVEKMIRLQLSVPGGLPALGAGERVYVTLKHKKEPIASRLVRAIQQLFLKSMPV